MHGQGTFVDARVRDDIRRTPDLVTSKRPALLLYQLSYRTTPLRGLWQHPPYFHDGSAATLEAVVDHYVRVLGLRLAPQQRTDLVQFLKSL
jgi:hypothetical protein